MKKYRRQLHYDIEAMGCGARCMACPLPEFDTIDEQATACLKSAKRALRDL